MVEGKKSHVVVLGAGFGGLTFCKAFQHSNERITVVDRTNHHLFQPLLYQVATTDLSAPDIAQLIRSVLSKRKDITVFLDRVTGFDLAARKCSLMRTAGIRFFRARAERDTGYFGHPKWERFASDLKTLDDALRIRRSVLLAFEKAENEAQTAEPVNLQSACRVY